MSITSHTECDWNGCNATSEDPPSDGWSTIIVYCDPKKLDFQAIDPKMIRRDAFLCPVHAKMLDQDFLKPLYHRILNRVDRAEGNA